MRSSQFPGLVWHKMDGQQKKKILSRCIDMIDQKLNFFKDD